MDQVVQILKEAEATPLAEVCRRHGIISQTFYRWTAKYSGLEVSDARRTLAEWRTTYNRIRPHSALGYVTPEEFARAGLDQSWGAAHPRRQCRYDWTTKCGQLIQCDLSACGL